MGFICAYIFWNEILRSGPLAHSTKGFTILLKHTQEGATGADAEAEDKEFRSAGMSDTCQLCQWSWHEPGWGPCSFGTKGPKIEYHRWLLPVLHDLKGHDGEPEPKRSWYLLSISWKTFWRRLFLKLQIPMENDNNKKKHVGFDRI